MRVDPRDGRCRTCGGTLEVTDADDVCLFVECQEGCGDSYEVETDAFGDGCMTYWLAMMTEKLEEDDE